MGICLGSVPAEIKVTGTCKMVKKIDVRELTNDAILQLIDKNDSTFFLRKKNDSIEAQEQNDIVDVYSAGNIPAVKPGKPYRTTPLVPKKLINPVLRIGQEIFWFNFMEFIAVYHYSATLEKKTKELEKSICCLEPIKKMYLWE